VASFAQCRHIISADDTFLTGKYKGILMVAVGMTAENQLLSLAFVLVEGENNESWLWFLGKKASTWSELTGLHDFGPSPWFG
jgi:hypothetical protein